MTRYGLIAFAIVCAIGFSLGWGPPSCKSREKKVRDCIKAPSCTCSVAKTCDRGKWKYVRSLVTTKGGSKRTSRRWTRYGICSSSASKSKSKTPKTKTCTRDLRKNCNLLKRYCTQKKFQLYMNERCCKTCGAASKAPTGSKKTGSKKTKKTGSKKTKKTGSKKTKPKTKPKTKKTGGSAGAEDQKCLDDANDYRRKHVGTPDMEWDAGLAAKAQKWADYLASSGKFDHDPANSGDRTGENLWASSGCCKLKVSTKGKYCAGADKAWYNEINYYSYATQKQKPQFANKMIGHFTQMVWKRSTKVGFGYATKESGGWLRAVVVAKYSPPGNYPNKKNDVLPLKGKRDEEEEEMFKDLDDERVLEDGITAEDEVMMSHYVPFADEADADEDDAGEPIIEMVK